MTILLDTHAFLWWISDDPRMPVSARALIADPGNRVLVSAASAWEMAVKAALGKLQVVGSRDIEAFVADHLQRNRFEVLPIGLRHALGVANLPPLHRDPFDRLLVSQARTESVPLVTADPMLRSYAVVTLW